jgi:hypothetical protein
MLSIISIWNYKRKYRTNVSFKTVQNNRKIHKKNKNFEFIIPSLNIKIISILYYYLYKFQKAAT